MNPNKIVWTTLITVFAVSLIAASVPVAEAARPDRRQVHQTNRIHQGKKNGELTKKETARLAAGQAKVQRQKKRARSDGYVTRNERRRIERTQDRQSRRIFRSKHNRRTRK